MVSPPAVAFGSTCRSAASKIAAITKSQRPGVRSGALSFALSASMLSANDVQAGAAVILGEGAVRLTAAGGNFPNLVKSPAAAAAHAASAIGSGAEAAECGRFIR